MTIGLRGPGLRGRVGGGQGQGGRSQCVLRVCARHHLNLVQSPWVASVVCVLVQKPLGWGTGSVLYEVRMGLCPALRSLRGHPLLNPNLFSLPPTPTFVGWSSQKPQLYL